CIKKAGGDPKDYLKAVEKTAAGQTQNLETDLVIIGGGGSGLTAAVRSAELGTKTVVLEKMQVLGGAAGICGGQIAVQSAQIQKDLGVQDDSPAWFAYDLLANGHMRNDLTALTAYSDNLGASVDWAMKSLGMTQFEEMKLQYRGEFSKDRSLYIKGAGAGFISLLTNKLSDMPVTIKTGTKVEKILKDEKGAVVGVEATDANGTKYVVRSKAVLLATGGYGANREMLAGDLQKALYYGPVCATGDGHRMAEAAGAKLINMELGKQYPNGIEVAPGLAKSTI
ncbi:FAD-dependent oxidoreductase, partial [Sutterella massiliensis]